MAASREYFVAQLEKAQETIPRLRELGSKGHQPEFRKWRLGTQQALNGLFGERESYALQFSRLDFWVVRLNVLSGGPHVWDQRDAARYVQDLETAEGILGLAVDEAKAQAPDSQAPERSTGPRQDAAAPPHVELHVHVSQLTSVATSQHVAQYINTLSPTHQAEVRALEGELRQALSASNAKETKTAMERLGKYGVAAFENIVAPIVVAWAKAQCHLPG